MNRKPIPGLFIAGTGTEVGKTYVGTLIVRAIAAQGKRVGVYKPAASGCAAGDRGQGTGDSGEMGGRRQEARGEREPEHADADRNAEFSCNPKSTIQNPKSPSVSDDAVALWEAAGRHGDLERVCPQRFVAPLAPHLAARAEGRTIDRELLRSGLDYWTERSDIVVVEGAGGLFSPISDDDLVANLAHEFGFALVVVAENKLGAIHATLATLLAAEHFRGGLPIAAIVLNRASNQADPSVEQNAVELAAWAANHRLVETRYRQSDFDRSIDWMAIALQDALLLKGVARR